MTFTSSLAMAFGIGIGFGVALERAGLGSARKLIGQFTLTDFTVFKVMFSAILTAMLGSFWLGRLGLIDLAAVSVPETFVLPQLVGGLIFGLGFVVAGLLAGVLGTGFAFPQLQQFYDSTARGTWQVPEALHLSYGVVVFIIVLIAVGGFQLVERMERQA